MKVPVTQTDFAATYSHWHHNPYSTLAVPEMALQSCLEIMPETPTCGFRAADCSGSVRMCENLVCITCIESTRPGSPRASINLETSVP